MDDKVKIVFAGHVDHGKSTLIGRLLFDTNLIASDKIKDLEIKSGADTKKLDFSYLTDHFEEERKQGITIDTTQIFFRTSKREYVIIDAPGHVEFIMNMVTGASQANSAILIVDATEGMQEQTMRHAYILSLLGVKNIILIINKMDLIEYDQYHFESTKTQLLDFLDQLGIVVLDCIPVSSIYGENITCPSSKMNWYTGNTLIQALDAIQINQLDDSENLTVPIQDVYHFHQNKGQQRIAVGKVCAGSINVNDSIQFLPSGETTTVNTIEIYGQSRTSAATGECIGITTKDPLFVERGNVLCKTDNCLTVSHTVTAAIFAMSSHPLRVDDKLRIRCSTQSVVCSIESINRKIDSASLAEIITDLDRLHKMEVGQVTIRTKAPIVYCPISQQMALGQIVLERDHNIVAAGIITD